VGFRLYEEDMLADVYSTLTWFNSMPVSEIEQGAANRLPDGRGLHCSTSQLNLHPFVPEPTQHM